MKYIDLQIAFELEINKLDDVLTKPTTSDIEYWLNIGLNKFVKTRYSGINYKTEGFEQSQKRIDDLRTLLVDITYDYPADNIYTLVYPFIYGPVLTEPQTGVLTVSKSAFETQYNITLPTNYMFTVGEEVYIISPDSSWPTYENVPLSKRTSVIEATIDNVTEKLENSLSEYRFHGNTGKPIRIYNNNNIILYTDNQYIVSKYKLTYLRIPTKIDIHANPTLDYLDMPEHTHIEIVKLAVQAYLENQSNQRYSTYSNEVATME